MWTLNTTEKFYPNTFSSECSIGLKRNLHPIHVIIEANQAIKALLITQGYILNVVLIIY